MTKAKKPTMKDTLISFPTASLAKEKGFTFVDTKTFYKGTKLQESSIYSNNDFWEGRPCCSAPTQSLLQRWLRKECMNKDISVIRVYGGAIGTKDGWHCILNDKSLTKTFLTYEEALEDGLKKALELI